MKPIAVLVIALFHSACCSEDAAKTLTPDEFGRLFTAEVVTKHFDSGRRSSGEPTIESKDGDTIVSFPDVMIRIGSGGSFFTEEDATEAKEGLFAALLGDALSPEIGLRAHVFGIEDDILLFTTSDGRFDVRIEPAALTPQMDVVGLGAEISDIYDRKTKRAEPQR